MSNLSLPINHQQLVATLEAHGVEDAEVFGSFARGEAGPASDLDLLVTYRPGTSLFDVIDLQTELEQLTGRQVDLISKRSLRPRLAKRIEHDTKPLSAFV